MASLMTGETKSRSHPTTKCLGRPGPEETVGGGGGGWMQAKAKALAMIPAKYIWG